MKRALSGKDEGLWRAQGGWSRIKMGSLTDARSKSSGPEIQENWYPSFSMELAGMGRTMDKANDTGREVARERRYNRADASPGKNTWAMDEKQNAERPNPAITRPIVVA